MANLQHTFIIANPAKAVTGPKRCVICNGKPARVDVTHLDGDESNGEPKNLAYGCRSCNAKLAYAFKNMGPGVPTRQYNPAKKGVPTYAQYLWGVTHHSRGAHDEGGAIIRATPRSKRIEYAGRIAAFKAARRGKVPF